MLKPKFDAESEKTLYEATQKHIREAKEAKKAVLKVKNHADIEISYKILPISKIHTSHNPLNNFCANPNYAYENERLYHREQASRDKVIDLASHLDPAFLLESPSCVDGAPVIDRNGNVLGGNGRAMAISFAYEYLRASFGLPYKEAIKAYAEENFIDVPRGDVILVRELVDDISEGEGQALISCLNLAFTHARDQKADARSRGLRLTKGTLQALAYQMQGYDTLRELMSAKESRGLVKMLIADGVIGDHEKNQYIDCDDMLNPAGKTILEASLRSRIFPDYESLNRLNSVELAKLDAAIPAIVQCENVSGWELNKAIANAITLTFEYKIDPIDDISKFLKSGDMIKGYIYQRYTALEVKIFRMILESKKGDFVKAFKRYQGQATISTEAGGFGIGMTQKEAVIKIFELEDMIMERKIEDKTEKAVSAGEKLANGHENKAVETSNQKTVKANKQSKNDCTKSNSTLVESMTASGELENGQALCDRHFGFDCELIANSKTQFRITDGKNEIPGYRLIRSGRQWQIRRLNEVIDQAISPEIAPQIESEVAPIAEIQPEPQNMAPETANKDLVKEKIAEIFSELEKLGWEKTDSDKFLKRNFKGGFKGTVNPAGNRIFHIATHKNKICLQRGWDNLFVTEILADTDAKKFAASFNAQIIEHARKTGEYADLKTLDGVIEKTDLKNFLAMPEYTRPLEYLPTSKKSEKTQKILYTAKTLRALKIYITRIYGNGAIPIKQGKSWRIFTDKGHIPCVYLKKSNNIFILYKEPEEPKKANLKAFLAMPEYIRPMNYLPEDKPQAKKTDPCLMPDRELAKEIFQNITPPWAKAAIMARFYERDRNHDSVLKREVLLGFSKHTRDLFPEMRKFAALYEPTADLAKNGIEYRQKWSMGKGYFLAGEDDREGWNIKKLPLKLVSFERLDFSLYAEKSPYLKDPVPDDRPQGQIERKETPESVPEKPDKHPQWLKNRSSLPCKSPALKVHKPMGGDKGGHKRTWVYPEKTQISSFYDSPGGSAAYTVPIAPRLKTMQEARAFMKIMSMKPPEQPIFMATRMPLDAHIKMLL